MKIFLKILRLKERDASNLMASSTSVRIEECDWH